MLIYKYVYTDATRLNWDSADKFCRWIFARRDAAEKQRAATDNFDSLLEDTAAAAAEGWLFVGTLGRQKRAPF